MKAKARSQAPPSHSIALHPLIPPMALGVKSGSFVTFGVAHAHS